MKHHWKWLSVPSLVVGIAAIAPLSRAQTPGTRITINRQARAGGCITGYLSVDDRIVAYTLERPEIGNISDISAIPAGRYSAIVRYDHADAWRLELQNVPGRSNVQIHIGNWVNQTRGCILVGSRVRPDACSLEGSTAAYAALRRAIYGDAAGPPFPERRFTVTVADGG